MTRDLQRRAQSADLQAHGIAILDGRQAVVMRAGGDHIARLKRQHVAQFGQQLGNVAVHLRRGKVMAQLKPQLQGRADMTEVSKLIKVRLS